MALLSDRGQIWALAVNSKVHCDKIRLRKRHVGGVETTHITDMEEQTLQVRELGGSEGQEVEVGIEGGTGCCLVFLEGIGGNQREGGALIRGSEM